MTLLFGCASIVGDATQSMPISGTPGGATVTITDATGLEVFSGETPATVTLQKSDGSYWSKKSYTVTVSRSGYAPQETAIEPNPKQNKIEQPLASPPIFRVKLAPTPRDLAPVGDRSSWR